MRERLDAAYPGWRDKPEGPRAPSPAPQPPLTLDAALPLVLEAIEGLSPSRWAAVRAVLDQVVTRPDLHDEAQAELLHLLTTKTDKRPGTG